MRIALGVLVLVSGVHLGAQLLGAEAVIAVLCAPRAGGLLAAVGVYAVAIMAMAVLATGLGRLAGLGGAVFVLSDSLIALSTFGVLTLPGHGFWVMSTYLAAQVMLVLAVRGVAARERRDPRTGVVRGSRED